MDKPLLNDPSVYPDEPVLKNVLGKTYSVFATLMQEIRNEPLLLEPEWRYYKDGHAWLCKVVHKKKTVFWLSVWDENFKITFYFTEKTAEGIPGLPVSETLKSQFRSGTPVGKLLPLTVSLQDKEHLEDVLQIAAYKKSQK